MSSSTSIDLPLTARTAEGNRGDPVIQFSVFVENRFGRLSDLIRALNDHHVHVMAITILDNTDSALIRMVVDDPDQARALYRRNGFAFTECEVLAVEIDTEARLKDVLHAMLIAEVNIHYIYSFISRPREKCALVISVEDVETASQSLVTHQFRVLRQNDISR